MELTVGEWYNEPEARFNFSYRILQFIKQAIEQGIMAPSGLSDNYPEKSLHLRVTTRSDQDKLEVKMGPFRENSTSVNCKIFFPYLAIIHAEKPLDAYVEYFIQAIPLIFSRWGVSEQQIREVAAVIRTEILNNPYYELTEEEKKELHADKQPTTRILKDWERNKRSFANLILERSGFNWLKKLFRGL